MVHTDSNGATRLKPAMRYGIALALGALGAGLMVIPANATELPPPTSFDVSLQCGDGASALVTTHTEVGDLGPIDINFILDGEIVHTQPTDENGNADYTIALPGAGGFGVNVSSSGFTGGERIVDVSEECAAEAEPPAQAEVGSSTATGVIIDGKPVATVTVPVTVPEGATGTLEVVYEGGSFGSQELDSTRDYVFTGEVPCCGEDIPYTVTLNGLASGEGSIFIECPVVPTDPTNPVEPTDPTVPTDPGILPGSGPDPDPETLPGTGTDTGTTGPSTDTGTKTIADATDKPGAGTGDTVVTAAAQQQASAGFPWMTFGGAAIVLAAIVVAVGPRVREHFAAR